MIQQDTEGYTQLAMSPQGDERLYVRFFSHAEKDEAKSAEAGRAIFADKDYVEIRVPGRRDNMVGPVTEEHRQRFAKQYADYKAGAAEQLVGTPLAAVPWLTRSQVEELAFLKVRTVEQLAGVADSVAQQLALGHSLKRRAQDFLDAAAGAAPAEKLRAELATRDAEIAALKAQLSDLAGRFEASQKKKG